MSVHASPPASSLAGSPVRIDRVATPRLSLVVLVAVLAGIVNLTIRWVARGPLGVSSDFPPLQSVGGTITASIVGVTGAALVFALPARFTRRPIAMFRAVAVVCLLLSLGGPLSARSEAGGSWTAVAVLIAMHVVTAAIAVGALTSFRRQEG